MVSNNNMFRPHLGHVISDLFRLLHAAQHGTEALIYSIHPREAVTSTYLAIIFGRIAHYLK